MSQLALGSALLALVVLGSSGVASVDSVDYSGTATWYCGSRATCTAGYGPSDLIAAIDRKQVRIPKGTLVTVTSGSRSVTVRIVDTCACAGRRIIDLSKGAFSRLASPSAGVIPVTLSFATERPDPLPTAPATDVDPLG